MKYPGRGEYPQVVVGPGCAERTHGCAQRHAAVR